MAETESASWTGAAAAAGSLSFNFYPDAIIMHATAHLPNRLRPQNMRRLGLPDA
jgi:hypothetical protein